MSWGIGDRVGVAVSAGAIATFNSRRPGPVPSLVLDFAGTGTLDSRVTFTRSTTATYYNSSGVLSTAAINAARFDYNPSTLAPLGLLIEQSSTNLFTYSQDFTNAVWGKSSTTITNNATTAPDGTSTGNNLTPTTVSAIHRISSAAIGLSAGNTYTFSVYAKANGYNYLYINAVAALGAGATFNISTGVVTANNGGTSSITSVGNGWYRCTITNPYVSNNGILFQINSTQTGATDQTFTGDGTSGVYLWNSQAEALAFATSCIPTTSAQVTRASDNASMTGTNFSSWFNQGQGTFYGEMDLSSFATTQALMGVNQNDSYGAGKGMLLRVADPSQVNFGGNSSSVNVNSGTPLTKNNVFKLAGSYNISTAFQGVNYNNSSYVSNNTLDYAGQGNQLRLGGITSSTNLIGSGHIRKFAYYPIQITASQSQSLTGS
jgi:hypothetical protein